MIATSLQSGGSDEVERQLIAFFRREAPAPWPVLRAPVKAPTDSSRPQQSSSGRAALAASIAVLLIGGWFLSGRLPAPVPSVGALENGAASVPAELRTNPMPPAHHRR